MSTTLHKAVGATLTRRPAPATVIALVALVLAAGGVSHALVPAGDGTIVACFNNSTGVVRVIDPSAGDSCNDHQTRLLWKDGISGAVADSDRLAGKDSSEFVRNGQGAGGDLTGSYPAPTVRSGAIGPSEVGVMPSVRVRSDTDQEIPSTTVLTPISFDRETWDTADMADLVLDDEGLTVRTTGKYLITAQISWLAGAGGGSRTALISVAGAFSPGGTTTVSGVAGQSTAIVVTAIAHVNTGSKIGLRVAQTSGSPLRLNRFHTNGAAWVAAHWIGP